MKDWVPKIRFSLATLMAVVAIVATACAALRFASELWASTMFTLALALLCVALLGALFSQASARSFWAGFALVGCLYLIMVFGPWCSMNVSPHLLTTKLVDWLHPKLQPSSPPGTGVVAGQVKVWDATTGQQIHPLNGGTGPVLSLAFSPDGKMLASQNCASCHNTAITAVGSKAAVVVASREDFQRVGHSLLASLVAFSGGMLARFFLARQRGRSEQSGQESCK